MVNKFLPILLMVILIMTVAGCGGAQIKAPFGAFIIIFFNFQLDSVKTGDEQIK